MFLLFALLVCFIKDAFLIFLCIFFWWVSMKMRHHQTDYTTLATKHHPTSVRLFYVMIKSLATTSYCFWCTANSIFSYTVALKTSRAGQLHHSTSPISSS